VSDFETYDTCPDRSDLATGRCHYAGCDDLATHVTRFYKPNEFVPYCQDHAWDMLGEAGGKSVRAL